MSHHTAGLVLLIVGVVSVWVALGFWLWAAAKARGNPWS